MKYLETILRFLTGLARIIFPRKQKPAADDCPCPHPYPRPLPDGDHPAVSPDGADGGDADGHRSDSLALQQSDRAGNRGGNYTSEQCAEQCVEQRAQQCAEQRVEPINLAGYSLMAIGSLGCIYKMLMA